MNLFGLNLLLAILWMAVNGSFSLTGLVVGFVLGLGVLYLGRPLYPSSRYHEKLWRTLRFFFWFMKELWVSSLRVAHDVLTRRAYARPAVIAVPTDAETDFELTLLACAVTLTPGTLSLDISPDRKTLYIHAMFVDDVEAVRRETKEGMERRILELTR